MNGYAERRDALAVALRGAGAGATVALAKRTSNLFRDREQVRRQRLDVSAFDHVLSVDRDAGWVDTEGMVTYQALADATLAHGTMPLVVPELATITIGGAAAGVGIESTSFRYGLVHETLVEYDILTGSGEVVTCNRDNTHADLFFGFPNSYGTLGYALRLRARTRPVQPYVALTHRRFDSAAAYFDGLRCACEGDADFVEGVVFDERALYLTEGRFAASAPRTSDYGYEHVYYRSIRENAQDWLGVRDYLWRWDTDWFWCSKNVGAQLRWLRPLFGRKRLNSRFYQKIMRLNAKLGLTRSIDALRGGHRESVIQDVDVPIARAEEFLAFLLAEIRVLPIWVCPIRASAEAGRFTLYPMKPGELYVNFGFWDVLRRRKRLPPGHFNRRIEEVVTALGGVKSLYSESYYDRDTFWKLHDRNAYARLKARYDPNGRFPDLYDKVVRRQ